MILLFKGDLLQEMNKFLEKHYPEEGCGLLLGKRQKENFIIEGLYFAKNIWPNQEEKKRRYALDPKDFLQAEKLAESKGLELLGIFHSHPDYEAYPSSFDIEMAWEGYLYLITGLREGKVEKVRAFYFLKEKEFIELRVNITEEVGHEFC